MKIGNSMTVYIFTIFHLKKYLKANFIALLSLELRRLLMNCHRDIAVLLKKLALPFFLPNLFLKTSSLFIFCNSLWFTCSNRTLLVCKNSKVLIRPRALICSYNAIKSNWSHKEPENCFTKLLLCFCVVRVWANIVGMVDDLMYWGTL